MPTSSRRLCGLIVVLASAASPPLWAQVSAQELSLRVVRDAEERPIALEALGLSKSQRDRLAAASSPEAPAKFLAVRVIEEAPQADQPVIVGTYAMEGAALRFTPRFAFRHGV